LAKNVVKKGFHDKVLHTRSSRLLCAGLGIEVVLNRSRQRAYIAAVTLDLVHGVGIGVPQALRKKPGVSMRSQYCLRFPAPDEKYDLAARKEPNGSVLIRAE
jgi:hypothetical protein